MWAGSDTGPRRLSALGSGRPPPQGRVRTGAAIRRRYSWYELMIEETAQDDSRATTRTRREALQLVAAALTAGWWFPAFGCGGGSSQPTAAQRAESYDPDLQCTDTSGMWPAEVATRTDNEYSDRSTEKDEFCFNCTNFQAPDEPATCGACDTVKGPINPLGWCTAWTEKRH